MIWGFLRAFGLALLKLPLWLIGLPMVWVALPYRSFALETTTPFSQFPAQGSWMLVRLPKWALWWDNAFDGMLGDKRGWWANECDGQAGTRYNMWRWAALRNPANYFSRNVCGIDVSQIRVEKVAGNLHDESVAPYRGFFLLKGTAQNGRIYPRLYMEFAIHGNKGLMLDFGWKIKLSHNGTPSDAPEKDRLKGIVFTGSPWKELS